MIFECTNCEAILEEEELNVLETSYEAYYGVSHMFGSRNSLTLHTCPNCGSEEIRDITNKIHSDIEEAVVDYKDSGSLNDLFDYVSQCLKRELSEIEMEIIDEYM